MNVALCPQQLNILSICTGGAGLDLGVELAIPSARTVCMVEREAFAGAQLVSAMEAGLLAPAPIWSDARTFDGRAWRGAVDGLIGGIPCQPHSLAGRKQGSNDARDLWSTARRIIVQSRAWFVVIENVGGMLAAGSDEIAGAQRVFRDLSKLGFEVEGGLFTAAEVGAPHQRERIFMLAVADPSSEQRRARRDATRRAGGAHAEPAGPSAGVPGVGLADAYQPGPSITSRKRGDARSERETSERSSGPLVHPERSERRPVLVTGHEPDRQDRRRDQTASWVGEPSQLVDDASIARGRPISVQPGRQDEADSDANWSSLFPPGPGDLSRWRDTLERTPELEPAFRRVADGLATRMDVGRVDRLRMLGNGVVPLQAAYALRTLVTRLAARGSAGAARLVRMMEGIEA